MSTLQPVPGPNITDKNQLLLAPWRSWFSALYTYVTQQIGNAVTALNPTMTGVISLNGVKINTGTGSPQTVVTGNPGDIYINTLGGLSTLWVKQSGTGTANGWVDGPWYGSFYDSTTQTIASTTTAYPITLNTTDSFNGVILGTTTSQIICQYPGFYNLQFSAQLENTDVADQDVQMWIRQNGTDVVASNGLVSVPSKHGAVNGHTVVAWNYIVQAAANDYFEFYWQSSSTSVSLKTYPAGATPTTPVSPSMSVSMVQV
jgi:hypothetical protein